MTEELETKISFSLNEKGVRQGCMLLPGLFNIYGEIIMRRKIENWHGEISIGSNLSYTDDLTFIEVDEGTKTEPKQN